MLLVLEAFVELTSEFDNEKSCTPLQWTNIMLAASGDQMKHADVIGSLFTQVFKFVCGVEATPLEEGVTTLRKRLRCPLFCVDEAQRFLDTSKYGKYKGPSGSDLSVFTCLLDCVGLVVLGTGFAGLAS